MKQLKINRILKPISFSVIFLIILTINGCCVFQNICPLKSDNNTEPFKTTYTTPRNIYFVKQELTAYYNSGGYEAGLDQVGDAAMKYLQSCKDTPGKLAIVFDIDETSLSNYKYEKDTDYGYSAESWEKWLKSGNPVVIKPSLVLFKQAKKLGVSVFFITGGKENQRHYYEDNLKKAGYSGWTKLIMKPDGRHYKSAGIFKTEQRKKLTEEGYRIIINIGDQYSDLSGGYADSMYKYPNPFYYVP